MKIYADLIQENKYENIRIKSLMGNKPLGVAESYRFDIYDIGSPGTPNIQLAKVTGQEDFRGCQ